jgi:spore germination protein YaaH
MAQVQARPLVFGYVAWWVPEALTVRDLDAVDRIKFMEIRVGAEGKVVEKHGWPQQWKSVRERASALGIPVDLAITLFSPADFNAIFSSPEKTQRLMGELLSLAKGEGVAGLHLDVEIFTAVETDATRRYRQFVVDLARELKAMTPTRLLSAFFNVGAEQHLYDAASLVGVDHVIVQGYDAHWVDGESAGPVAPLYGPDTVTWDKMLATVQGLGIYPQRILMGFPTYGYEWKVKPCGPRGRRVGPGESTVFGRFASPLSPKLRISIQDRVLAHGAQYDLGTGSAHYLFETKDGTCVVGWFEDWWTLHRKLDWIEQQQVAGIVFFPLGYDQGQLIVPTARRWRAAPQ